jgi:transcription-repair coupling factor (superfamily II helicase)
VEEIKGWLQQMAAQLPGADGLTEAQRAEQQVAQNEARRRW